MSEEEGVASAAQEDGDNEDLDELLCSALEDLEKPVTLDPPSPKPNTDATVPNDLEKAWNEEFAEQFKQYLQDDSSGQSAEAVAASLQKMTEAAAEAFKTTAETPTSPTDGGDPVAAAISQTLRNLADNASNLQSPLTEDEIMNMFGSLGIADGPNGDSDIFPFMQNMMQSLLSKEILYPALKNIVDKYPAWLDQNKPTLSQERIDAYVKQMGLMQEVCSELEKETASDTDDAKNQRFDKILELMQKMQDCGLPPQELMGDLPQDLSPSGNMGAMPDMSQCSLM